MRAYYLNLGKTFENVPKITKLFNYLDQIVPGSHKHKKMEQLHNLKITQHITRSLKSIMPKIRQKKSKTQPKITTSFSIFWTGSYQECICEKNVKNVCGTNRLHFHGTFILVTYKQTKIHQKYLYWS